MDLRLVGAGVLAAITISHGAQAATIENYNLKLRYDGTIYYDATVYDAAGETLFEGSTNSFVEPWGLPTRYDLTAGDIVGFTASIYVPDDPSTEVSPGNNGGYLISCTLAGQDCRGATQTYPGLQFAYGDSVEVSGSAREGGFFGIGEWLDNQRYTLAWGGTAELWTRFTVFTVVESLPVEPVDPAPVPLPAGAALLPAALGGLALIRRRRKKAA